MITRTVRPIALVLALACVILPWSMPAQASAPDVRLLGQTPRADGQIQLTWLIEGDAIPTIVITHGTPIDEAHVRTSTGWRSTLIVALDPCQGAVRIGSTYHHRRTCQYVPIAATP